MHIEPFQISVSDVEIDDLRRRLRDSRWASMTPSESWATRHRHDMAARIGEVLGRQF